MFLASAVLACGSAVAEANPASAMPRNGCLDEQHWWAQFSQLTNAAETAWAVWEAWETPELGTDLQTGVTTYIAHAPAGDMVALGEDAWTWDKRNSKLLWDAAFTKAYDFYNETPVCSL
jgi:hypothetical protein